jgi:dipeptidyl aminopeptidase/acylaminoacyl peptidase
MLAASRTTRLNAIVLGATPTDLLKGLESRPDMEKVFKQRIPDYETRKADALRERSPLFPLDKIDPQLPILILHGAADVRTPAEHALDLAFSLQRKKHPYAMKIYANGDHGLTAMRRDVLEECVGWFGSYLSTTIAITPEQERKSSADSAVPSGR